MIFNKNCFGDVAGMIHSLSGTGTRGKDAKKYLQKVPESEFSLCVQNNLLSLSQSNATFQCYILHKICGFSWEMKFGSAKNYSSLQRIFRFFFSPLILGLSQVRPVRSGH